MSKLYSDLSTSYSSYQDYLHQKNKKSQIQRPVFVPYRDISPPHYYDISPNKVQSNVTYYPVQRTEIEYKDNTVVERIPRKKKIIEMVERKELEMVPKEVSKIDYYVVQHQRKYVKQVVPEIRIETVTVPKKIKNIESIPVEKQIVYYPSHLTDMQQIKQQAKETLSRQGVGIREDAEYRPIIQRNQSLVSGLQNSKILNSTSYRLSPDRTYRPLSPPRHYRDVPQMLGSKSNRYSRYPRYNKDKYSLPSYDYSLDSNNQDYSAMSHSDYTFAEKDQYRYDLAMHNNSRRLSSLY